MEKSKGQTPSQSSSSNKNATLNPLGSAMGMAGMGGAFNPMLMQMRMQQMQMMNMMNMANMQKMMLLKKMQLAQAQGDSEVVVMEPLEADPNSKIESIQGKRLGPRDQPQYLVQWKRSAIKMEKDDQKDSGWEDRSELLKEHSNLGTVNAYELEFYKEIAEIVKNTVEDSKKLVKR